MRAALQKRKPSILPLLLLAHFTQYPRAIGDSRVPDGTCALNPGLRFTGPGDSVA